MNVIIVEVRLYDIIVDDTVSALEDHFLRHAVLLHCPQPPNPGNGEECRDVSLQSLRICVHVMTYDMRFQCGVPMQGSIQTGCFLKIHCNAVTVRHLTQVNNDQEGTFGYRPHHFNLAATFLMIRSVDAESIHP